MANGPFMLILKSDDPDGFLRYVDENPRHKVTIKWTRRNNSERTIRSVQNPEAYSLSFGLPETLGNWIFGDDKRATHRARNVKESFFSDITIYRFIDNKVQVIRLTYDAQETKNRVKNG